MEGIDYFSLAAVILLLLPVVVLPWEGRRVPDGLYVALGIGGLVAAGLKGGAPAMGWSMAAGLVSLAVAATLVTVIRSTMNLQVLTGGHLKLLAAGAVWLGPVGALLMVCGAFAGLFGMAFLRRSRSTGRPPNFSAIVAVMMLCVGIQQALPDGERGAEPASAAATR